LLDCFDKLTSRKFLVNINQVGCEKYFYDTSRGTNQVIEKRLGKFESKFNKAYGKIIKRGSLNSLTKSDKVTIAVFIATQEIRTKEFRERIRDLIKQLTERLSRENLSEKLEKQLKKSWY